MRKGLKPSRRHFLAVAAGSVISPRVALAQSSRQVACLTDWLHQRPPRPNSSRFRMFR